MPWEGPAGGDERLDAVTKLLAGSIAIHRLGDRAWALAATHVPGRTGRECRDRWRRKNGLPDEEQEERPRPMPRSTFSSAESHKASKAAQRDVIRRANSEAARQAQATLARLAARLRDPMAAETHAKRPRDPASGGKRRLAGAAELSVRKEKARRCEECENCTRLDRSNCGRCINCLDKPQFGGRNTRKQMCMALKCLRPTKQMRAGPPNDILHYGDLAFQGANAVVEVEAVPVDEVEAAQVDEAEAASVVELDPSQVVEVEAQVVEVEAQVVEVEASPAVPDAAGMRTIFETSPILDSSQSVLAALEMASHAVPDPIQSEPILSGTSQGAPEWGAAAGPSGASVQNEMASSLQAAVTAHQAVVTSHRAQRVSVEHIASEVQAGPPPFPTCMVFESAPSTSDAPLECNEANGAAPHT